MTSVVPARKSWHRAVFWSIALAGGTTGTWLLSLALNDPLVAMSGRTTIDLAGPVSDAFEYAARGVRVFGHDLSHWTREAADIAGLPLDFLRGVLADGFTIYRLNAETTIIPPIPWPVMITMVVAVVWSVAGLRLALASALFLGFVGAMGLWQSTMQTLSAIIVSVTVSVLLGLMLGIAAYRSRRLNHALDVLFDILQTLPVFSYLVPLLVFFGFGPSTALVATILFAMPPMARVTALALHQISAEIREYADVAGCDRHQKMWWALLPAVRAKILLGVNQCVLFTLAMVIIASVIGAGGLGGDVLNALRGLRMGDAISAGLAITLLAILVDRCLHRWSTYTARRIKVSKVSLRFPSWGYVILGLVVTGSSILAVSGRPEMAAWPDSLTFDRSGFWRHIVLWINSHLGTELGMARDALTTYLLRPVRDLLTSIPWLAVTAIVSTLCAALGGWRFALAAVLVFSLIALGGYWERAMFSLYLVSIAFACATIIGIPVGLWAGLTPRAYAVVKIAVDTLQTLPTFVYLIPVVIIFGVGDVPALMAIVLFAIAPAIRYTAEGIHHVPSTILEASDIAGTTVWQKLLWVQIPSAAPQIILGLNQTLLMAFNMLVITALVGTRGLEQVTLESIVKLNPGQGLLAGLALSAMAIVFDRMLRRAGGTMRRQERLGRTH